MTEALLLALAFFLPQTVCYAAEHYTNPVIGSNHPDPGVLRRPSGGYIAVSTSNYATADQPAFPILTSANLVDWAEVGHVFPGGEWPTWAATDMWAPEIHVVGDCFHVYFSARKADGTLAVGCAISENCDDPLGPYRDSGKPIVERPVGVIDVHWFRDPNTGIPYLSYKTDENAIGEKSKIYLRQVNEDGLTFDDNAPEHLILVATEESDVNVVEGQSLIYREPFYYVFFSGHEFDTAYYHASVARSVSLTGPYERYLGETFLHTDLDLFENGLNSTFVGPGHGTPIQDSDGEWWYVYHSWAYGLAPDPGRMMLLDRINWTGDGWPLIGSPSTGPTLAPVVN